MCGIVGAVAQRDVAPILLEGLKRLEYRGYDSAGVAILGLDQTLQRVRTQGKVAELINILDNQPILGNTGVAHTRWATHGVPSENNAHPHMSGSDIAIVHNGIIENHEELRNRLINAGYQFNSETDSEIIVHLIHYQLSEGKPLIKAIRHTIEQLNGAFALGIVHRDEPNRLFAVRRGSPLVIGLGLGENFIASDQMALLPVAEQFIYLEEGDIADVRRNDITIYDESGKKVKRQVRKSELSHEITDKGKFRHFMQKEIFDQPRALTATFEGRFSQRKLLVEAFGQEAPALFERIHAVQIVACGTSYHAGMVARYWLEGFAGIPCQVEIASEFRYRQLVVQPNTLFITISQSGETADTLAALRAAKTMGYEGFLSICNVPGSSLVRESDLVLMTRAGAEIGVASTKAFTTQLAAFLMLTIALGRGRKMDEKTETTLVKEMKKLPEQIEQCLSLDKTLKKLAKRFTDKQHALFLGRGSLYPIALEGALKLKEISYIHAEAYPAGELKHGPLALVDKDMPVIAVAPNDELLEKLKSNLQEVQARGGELIVFADSSASLKNGPGVEIIEMPPASKLIAPILYTIPLQLLAYHVALIKGTDVDQPRNLAKSVTVE